MIPAGKGGPGGGEGPGKGRVGRESQQRESTVVTPFYALLRRSTPFYALLRNSTAFYGAAVGHLRLLRGNSRQGRPGRRKGQVRVPEGYKGSAPQGLPARGRCRQGWGRPEGGGREDGYLHQPALRHRAG